MLRDAGRVWRGEQQEKEKKKRREVRGEKDCHTHTSKHSLDQGIHGKRHTFGGETEAGTRQDRMVTKQAAVLRCAGSWLLTRGSPAGIVALCVTSSGGRKRADAGEKVHRVSRAVAAGNKKNAGKTEK